MRWKINQSSKDTQWHSWFAWHPVQIGATWVWLERIQRRRGMRAVGWPTIYEGVWEYVTNE